MNHYIGIESYLSIKCSKGRISELDFVGIKPFLQQKAEKSDFPPDFCSSSETHAWISNCTSEFLNTTQIEAAFRDECTGQKECEFDIVGRIQKGSNNQSECVHERSRVYI